MNTILKHQKLLLIGFVTVVFFLRVELAFRPEVQIFSEPYIDDTFYTLTYSNHLALGNGFSIDGIHQSNGSQPMLTFLYVPLFLLADFDKELVVRYSFILNALIESLSLIVLFFFMNRLVQFTRKRLPTFNHLSFAPLIALLLWSFTESSYRNILNGLETNLTSLFILLSLWQYAKVVYIQKDQEEASVRQYFILAVILGGAVLARIDSVLLVIAFLGCELTQKMTAKHIKLALICGIPFLVSLPWWIFNLASNGSLIPISGQSESLVINIGENLHHAAIAISNCILVPLRLPFWGAPLLIHSLWITIAMISLIVLQRQFNFFKNVFTYETARIVKPYVLTSIALVMYYVLFFGAPYFIDRYLQPFRILCICSFSIACLLIWETVILRFPTRTNLLRFAILLCIAGVGGYNVSKYSRFFSTSNCDSRYLAGLWANSNPNLKIGMIQSGVSGFIADNVINLDGKVNPFALQARKSKNLSGYIFEQSIDYVADWPYNIEVYLDDFRGNENSFNLNDTIVSNDPHFPSYIIYENMKRANTALHQVPFGNNQLYSSK